MERNKLPNMHIVGSEVMWWQKITINKIIKNGRKILNVNGTDDMLDLEEFCRIDQDFIEVASNSKINMSSWA